MTDAAKTLPRYAVFKTLLGGGDDGSDRNRRTIQDVEKTMGKRQGYPVLLTMNADLKEWSRCDEEIITHACALMNGAASDEDAIMIAGVFQKYCDMNNEDRLNFFFPNGISPPLIWSVDGYVDDHGATPIVTDSVKDAINLLFAVAAFEGGDRGNLYGLFEKGMHEACHVPCWREFVTENVSKSPPALLEAEARLVCILEKMSTDEITAAMAVYNGEFTIDKMAAMADCAARIQQPPKAPGAGGEG